MDWRGIRLLVVCAFHLLVNVDCSSLPFRRGRMGFMGQSAPPRNIMVAIGITPCLSKCIIKPNPCDHFIGRKGCPTPINTLPRVRLVSSSGFEKRFIPQPLFPTKPSPLTARTKSTTTTTILEKGVTEEQHKMFTAITSPSPHLTTKATGDITVNPSSFWMIFKKK